MPSGVVHPFKLDLSIFSFMDVWYIFSFLMHFEQKLLYANNVDPDQTPRSVASELGLHYLSMSQT